MKHALIIICIALLSSCALFKKSNKTVSSTETKTEVGSAEQSSTLDTTKRKETSRVRFYFEPNAVTSPQLDKFPNIGTGQLKTAMNALKKSVNKLPGVTQDTSVIFANGYHLAMVELENVMESNLYKSTQESKRDTTTVQNKTDDKTNKKEPNIFLILGTVAFICGLIYFIIKK